MKKMLRLTAILVSLALSCMALFGCSGDDEKKLTAEQVKKQAQKAMDTAVAYTKQQKDEFMAKMNQQYDALMKQGDELMAKAKEQAAAGQEQAKQVLADLEAKQKVVEEKIAALKEAGDKAWAQAKPELEKALANLQAAYDKAKAQLK